MRFANMHMVEHHQTGIRESFGLGLTIRSFDAPAEFSFNPVSPFERISAQILHNGPNGPNMTDDLNKKKAATTPQW